MIRVTFHADSNSVKIRHVSSGISPCVGITSLKKDLYMAMHAISDMLRQKESPTRCQKKEVRKDQLRYCRSLFHRFVHLKILIRESLFYMNLEYWDCNTPSDSPKALGTKFELVKEWVRREVLSQSVRLMSVILARPNSRIDHMWMETLAPRKMRPQSGVGLGEHFFKLKNSEKASFYTPIEAKVMPAPTLARPVGREFVVDSGASTMSKKELSSEEMDTGKKSRTPVVLTANGEVHTHEEAQVFMT